MPERCIEPKLSHEKKKQTAGYFPWNTGCFFGGSWQLVFYNGALRCRTPNYLPNRKYIFKCWISHCYVSWLEGGHIMIFHQPRFPSTPMIGLHRWWPRFPWNKKIFLSLATFWGEVVWGRYNLPRNYVLANFIWNTRTNKDKSSWKLYKLYQISLAIALNSLGNKQFDMIWINSLNLLVRWLEKNETYSPNGGERWWFAMVESKRQTLN